MLEMKKALTFLLLTSCLISACASPQRRSVTQPPERPYSTMELLSIIESRNSAVNSVEGKLSSRIMIAGESRKATELILIKKPLHLRIDILSPFGSPLLTMATDGEDINLQYHAKNRFFSGKAGQPGIADILSPSLNMGEYILILAGGIPLINFDESKSGTAWEGEGYTLRLENETARQEILFDAERLYPLRSTIYDGQERVMLSITMDNYKGVSGFEFPSSIGLFMPLEAYEMKVKYSSIALNENLGHESFIISPPKGVLVEGLEELNF